METECRAEDEQLAVYGLSLSVVQRSKGQSAVGAAAYRAACSLMDERTDLVHDFTRKKGVLYSEIIAPTGSPVLERHQLWNAAEKAERRKDAAVGREFLVLLPAEMTSDQRRDLGIAFATYIAGRHGVYVDVALHAPSPTGDERNSTRTC